MSLKGQAKIDYQWDYMRRRRGSNTGSNTIVEGSNKPNIEAKLSKVGLTVGKDGLLGLTGWTPRGFKQ